MLDYSQKIVMVTGAAGNLGAATALAFRNAGARLILVDKEYELLEQSFPELETEDALFLSGDLTMPGVVEGMAYEAVEAFGGIDVLVNIAGGFTMGSAVHETPLETWEFMLDLNAKSVVNTARAIVPHMLEQGGGKIINVAARAALAGKARMGAYVASKSAVIRLTETMAAELKERGINVNCVLPGTIDTPENREAMPKANHAKWVPPAAIADVMLFLASDLARAVHGAAVPVYGLS